jgi:hypothetical protein
MSARPHNTTRLSRGLEDTVLTSPSTKTTGIDEDADRTTTHVPGPTNKTSKRRRDSANEGHNVDEKGCKMIRLDQPVFSRVLGATYNTLKRRRDLSSDGNNANKDDSKRTRLDQSEILPRYHRPALRRRQFGHHSKTGNSDVLRKDIIHKIAATKFHKDNRNDETTLMTLGPRIAREIKKYSPKKPATPLSADKDARNDHRVSMQDVVTQVTPAMQREFDAHEMWLDEALGSIARNIKTYFKIHPRYIEWDPSELQKERWTLNNQHGQDFTKRWESAGATLPVGVMGSWVSTSTHVSMAVALMANQTRPPEGTKQELEKQIAAIQRKGLECHRSHVKKYYFGWQAKVKDLQFRQAKGTYDPQLLEISTSPELHLELLMSEDTIEVQDAEAAVEEMENNIFFEFDEELLAPYHETVLASESRIMAAKEAVAEVLQLAESKAEVTDDLIDPRLLSAGAAAVDELDDLFEDTREAGFFEPGDWRPRL